MRSMSGAGKPDRPCCMRKLVVATDRDPELDVDESLLRDREAVAAHIEAGYDQAQRGELINGVAALAMLRRRRAERLRRFEGGPVD